MSVNVRVPDSVREAGISFQPENSRMGLRILNVAYENVGHSLAFGEPHQASSALDIRRKVHYIQAPWIERIAC